MNSNPHAGRVNPALWAPVKLAFPPLQATDRGSARGLEHLRFLRAAPLSCCRRKLSHVERSLREPMRVWAPHLPARWRLTLSLSVPDSPVRKSQSQRSLPAVVARSGPGAVSHLGPDAAWPERAKEPVWARAWESAKARRSVDFLLRR